MVFVYTMSTREPYWSVREITPDQVCNEGWSCSGEFFYKQPRASVDGYDAEVTMASVSQTEDEAKEILRKSLHNTILDTWQLISSALVRRIETIKEI